MSLGTVLSLTHNQFAGNCMCATPTGMCSYSPATVYIQAIAHAVHTISLLRASSCLESAKVRRHCKLSSRISDTPSPCAVRETEDTSISCSLSWLGSFSNGCASSRFLSTKRALGVARRTGRPRALRCFRSPPQVCLHHAVCPSSPQLYL
jgi:hypothetical protein